MPEIVAVGHRGAPRIATENTLPSIAAAAAAGAAWVEVDVKLARDGTPVLLHDTDLRRVWGRDELIELVDTARLPGRADGAADRVPTLVEALGLATELGVTLMIDLPGVLEAEPAAELVLSHRTTSVVFTGDPEALAHIRSRSATARVALSWEDPVLPDRALLDAVSPQYFNQRSDLLDARAVDELHARGMAVSAYTVDEPATMLALAAAGVDAIISNDIVDLVTTLRGRAARLAADALA